MYLGVITPFGIVFAINTIVFLIIVVIVLRRKDRSAKLSKPKKRMRKAFVVLLLAMVFGIGWAFGILGSEDRNVLSIIFQFLFIIIVGFHGLFIFINYPCRTKDARNQWKKLFYFITCRMNLYAKDSLQRSRNLPPKSSRNKSNVSVTKSSSQDCPYTDFSVGYVNAQYQPPIASPGIQGFQTSTPQAAALESIEEESNMMERSPDPKLPPEQDTTSSTRGSALKENNRDTPFPVPRKRSKAVGAQNSESRNINEFTLDEYAP